MSLALSDSAKQGSRSMDGISCAPMVQSFIAGGGFAPPWHPSMLPGTNIRLVSAPDAMKIYWHDTKFDRNHISLKLGLRVE